MVDGLPGDDLPDLCWRFNELRWSMGVKVGVRLDASLHIGVGHLMRCLTLADQLKQQGADVVFFTRGIAPAWEATIKCHGHDYRLVAAPEEEPWNGQFEVEDWMADAVAVKSALDNSFGLDWMVVDHYGLDVCWEQEVRSIARNILVIDDLADRRHDCDALLDQNLSPPGVDRYEALIPETSHRMIGCHYALLREEFLQARRDLRERNGMLENVLVFYGGGDATNETEKALEGLQLFGEVLELHVVIGAVNPHKLRLEQFIRKFEHAHLHVNIDYMPRLMANADLCLGAAGTATWERCALGLPALMTCVADNQVDIARNVEAAGAARYLGYFTDVNAICIADALRDLRSQPHSLRIMGNVARALVDAAGARRVATHMKDFR